MWDRETWLDRSERALWGWRVRKEDGRNWGHYEEEEELDISFEKGDMNKPSKPASTFP